LRTFSSSSTIKIWVIIYLTQVNTCRGGKSPNILNDGQP
jgi:hypothetical protein